MMPLTTRHARALGISLASCLFDSLLRPSCSVVRSGVFPLDCNLLLFAVSDLRFLCVARKEAVALQGFLL